MDRLTIPFLNGLSKLFLGRRCTMPRVHIGFVRYGDGGQQSLVVDRWVYRGNQYFSAYNTKQLFRADYPHGPYSYLPPYYTHGRFRAVFSRRNIMRITKILWRKWSRPGVFVLGVSLSLLGAFALFLYQYQPVQAATVVENIEMIERLQGGQIVGYSKLPGKIPAYRIRYGEGKIITSKELYRAGYTFHDLGANSLTIVKGGKSVLVTK
jgi:hypothetical protein